MKKYFIKDEDATYEVTEVEEEQVPQTDDVPADEPEALTPEETAALKRLAAVADKLIASITDANEDVENDETVEEFEDDDEEIDEEENEEEIIDTEAKTKDSKKSINDSVVSNKKTTVNDSIDDVEDEVANSWAERYSKYRNGGNL